MPKVRIPSCRAILAKIGAAPDPVPPPKQEIIKQRSLPLRNLTIFSFSARAAARPISGSMPVPKPRVNFSPKLKTLTAPEDFLRERQSVLAIKKSTLFNSGASSETIAAPPSPMPITLIRVFFNLRSSPGFSLTVGETIFATAFDFLARLDISIIYLILSQWSIPALTTGT